MNELFFLVSIGGRILNRIDLGLLGVRDLVDQAGTPLELRSRGRSTLRALARRVEDKRKVVQASVADALSVLLIASEDIRQGHAVGGARDQGPGGRDVG